MDPQMAFESITVPKFLNFFFNNNKKVQTFTKDIWNHSRRPQNQAPAVIISLRQTDYTLTDLISEQAILAVIVRYLQLPQSELVTRKQPFLLLMMMGCLEPPVFHRREWCTSGFINQRPGGVECEMCFRGTTTCTEDESHQFKGNE